MQSAWHSSPGRTGVSIVAIWERSQRAPRAGASLTVRLCSQRLLLPCGGGPERIRQRCGTPEPPQGQGARPSHREGAGQGQGHGQGQGQVVLQGQGQERRPKAEGLLLLPVLLSVPVLVPVLVLALVSRE